MDSFEYACMLFQKSQKLINLCDFGNKFKLDNKLQKEILQNDDLEEDKFQEIEIDNERCLYSFYYPKQNCYFILIGKNYLEKSKIQRFGDEILQEIHKMTKSDISKMNSDIDSHSGKEGVYQRQLEPYLEQKFKQYQSSIRVYKVKQAQLKVDEAKVIMQKNVIAQLNNNKEVEEKLLPTSQEIQKTARLFQKNAYQLEKEAKKREFWACSKKCILMSAVIALILLGIILGIYFGVN
ncbi:UNKNOWN [Stylonychia lemnae]|uniref:V-SNARE coiled-coil homology domain-containing protein n=1 Tax=Stylonychia lemnae TaxID=5949 RepID=A0A078B2Q7_STYLE|nr:UNKNOWN [Stylonychia lemnae]|eukprot:CDW88759.1 UNKNOWN [Stylonychia lemnae]